MISIWKYESAPIDLTIPFPFEGKEELLILIPKAEIDVLKFLMIPSPCLLKHMYFGSYMSHVLPNGDRLILTLKDET